MIDEFLTFLIPIIACCFYMLVVAFNVFTIEKTIALRRVVIITWLIGVLFIYPTVIALVLSVLPSFFLGFVLFILFLVHMMLNVSYILQEWEKQGE